MKKDGAAGTVCEAWYQSLKTYSGWPARGTIGAALVVLERLKEDCNLDPQAHRAKGGFQIQGASGAAVKAILGNFGETRPFLSEGGRTNRGGPADIESMLKALQAIHLGGLPKDKRIGVIELWQQFLVEQVQAWHSRQRLSFSFDVSKSAWQTVHEILGSAREVGKEGPVAQYLVGAKLQLRYPSLPVENFSFSTSDVQQRRAGDFLMNDTAFHVTVSPMTNVYEKCQANLRAGLQVYLIVPDRILAGTRQIAEATDAGRIFVSSLEAFIGGNLDEMAVFGRAAMMQQLANLLRLYNTRVASIEMDQSMMIEIPMSLSA